MVRKGAGNEFGMVLAGVPSHDFLGNIAHAQDEPVVRGVYRLGVSNEAVVCEVRTIVLRQTEEREKTGSR